MKLRFPPARVLNVLSPVPLAAVAAAWLLIGTGSCDDGVAECRVGDFDWVWLCGEAQCVSAGYSTGVVRFGGVIPYGAHADVLSDSRSGVLGLGVRRRVIRWVWFRPGTACGMRFAPGDRTTRTWMLYVPYPHLLAVAAMIPAAQLAARLRRRLRARSRAARGLCPRCGYNLTANTSGICPECGLVTAARPPAAAAAPSRLLSS